MPYLRRSDLPSAIKKLPIHAQEIYRSAFNNAWQEYSNAGTRRGYISREETAHRVAWGAVKRRYVKSGGTWVAKNVAGRQALHK